MPAYIMAQVTVTNPENYKEYVAAASSSSAKFGAKYIIRGGDVETLEGEPITDRLVVIEFKDMETLKAWYHSDEYQAAIPIRQANSTGRIMAVEGYNQEALK